MGFSKKPGLSQSLSFRIRVARSIFLLFILSRVWELKRLRGFLFGGFRVSGRLCGLGFRQLMAEGGPYPHKGFAFRA